MTSSKQVIHITAEELYGHIRATQEALVEIASYIGANNQLRNRILYINESVWENGLVSTEDKSKAITKEDLPLFFQGMKNANEYILNLIDARTPPSNQLGLEFSDHHEESDSVTVTYSQP